MAFQKHAINGSNAIYNDSFSILMIIIAFIVTPKPNELANTSLCNAFLSAKSGTFADKLKLNTSNSNK